MGYDWDVIVVGGGPAGISAAIRARWIKRYKSIPCSTLVIENAKLGGLAAWHGCLLTGPSWELNSDEIVSHLFDDLSKLNIPMVQARVTRIVSKGRIKEVHASDGRVFRSLAVIIATGIKALVNEKDYLGRGLEVTSMGYEFVVSHLKKLLQKRWKPGMVVVGSPKLRNLIPLIRELNGGGSSLMFVIEEDGKNKDVEKDGKDVVQGWVKAYLGDGYIKGVSLETAKGPMVLPCGVVLLDFNSYELAPTGRVKIGESKMKSSFIQVDLDMQTSVQGILAAGDATAGGYNSFSRAISQGMTAGLSAYRYVYGQKFGDEPPLFAYRARDFVLSKQFNELPELVKDLMPKALAGDDEIRAVLGKGWDWLPDRLNGRSAIKDISKEQGVSHKALQAVLKELVEKKMITLHVEIGS